MLNLVIILVVLGGGLSYLGFWPFDGSYSFLPKYADWKNKKANETTPPKK